MASILTQVYKEAATTSKGVVQMNRTLNKIYEDQLKANRAQAKFYDDLRAKNKREERDKKREASDLRKLLGSSRLGPAKAEEKEEEEGGGILDAIVDGIGKGFGLLRDVLLGALGDRLLRFTKNKLFPNRGKPGGNTGGKPGGNTGGKKSGGKPRGKTGGKKSGGKTGGKTNVRPRPTGNQQVTPQQGNPRSQRPPVEAVAGKSAPVKAPPAPSPTNISTRPGGPKPTSWIDKLKQGGSNLLKGTKNNLGKITRGGSDLLKKLGQNPLVKRIKGFGGALGRLAGPVIIAATMLPKMIELYNDKEYKNLARYVIASAGGLAVGGVASSAVAGLAALAGLPTGGVGAVPVFIAGMAAAAGAGGFTYTMIDDWLKEMGLADEDKSTDKDMEVTPIPEADLKDAAASKSEMQKQYDEMPKDKPGFDTGIIQKRARGGGIFDVPGHGQGDQVPMMLPPGSFVLNRVAAAEMFARGGSPSGMVPTLLEPGEKVFMPGDPMMDIAMMFNDTFSRFQKGGHVGIATEHIKKDEALSSVTKGPYPDGKSDWIREGGNSVISKTPWSEINDQTKLYSYVDGVGKPTIGWGSTYYDNIRSGTQPVRRGDEITKSKADNILNINISALSSDYSKEIPFWENMSDMQKASLISMGYNAPNFYSSKTFAPKLKSSLEKGDMKAAADNLSWGGPSLKRISESKSMLLKGPKDVTKPKEKKMSGLTPTESDREWYKGAMKLQKGGKVGTKHPLLEKMDDKNIKKVSSAPGLCVTGSLDTMQSSGVPNPAATGQDVGNNPRGAISQLMQSPFNWKSMGGSSTNLESPYGNVSPGVHTKEQYNNLVESGKVPSGALVFQTRHSSWNGTSDKSRGYDMAIAQKGGKEHWNGQSMPQLIYGGDTKKVIVLTPDGKQSDGSETSQDDSDTGSNRSGKTGGANNKTDKDGGGGLLGSIMAPITGALSSAFAPIQEAMAAANPFGEINKMLGDAMKGIQGSINEELQSDEAQEIMKKMKEDMAEMTSGIKKNIGKEMNSKDAQKAISTIKAGPQVTSAAMQKIREMKDPEAEDGNQTIVQVIPGGQEKSPQVEGQALENLPPGLSVRCPSWAAADYRYDRSLNTETL